MRDDLLDAQAAVNWAKSHIPVLQERILHWQRRRPYKIVCEPDVTDKRWDFLVAYPRITLDPLINGDVGAIINSTRTALDLLMSALLLGNGVKPNSKAHFPIRKTTADFLDAVDMLENKKWITQTEAAAIKRTKAYSGGHRVLYSIHQLDILRKHERLLTIELQVSKFWTATLMADDQRRIEHFDNKTVLCRIPASTFRPTPGNSHVTAEIFLNEPAIGVTNKPAVLALQVFTESVADIVREFPTSR